MAPKDVDGTEGMLREKDCLQVSRSLFERGLIRKATAFGEFFHPWTGRTPGK